MLPRCHTPTPPTHFQPHCSELWAHLPGQERSRVGTASLGACCVTEKPGRHTRDMQKVGHGLNARFQADPPGLGLGAAGDTSLSRPQRPH